MYGYLLAVGIGTVLFSGVVSYAMARRYGWGAAVALPALALVVMIAMQWQNRGLGFSEGVQFSGTSLVFSAPVILGVLVGIAIAKVRRG